MEIYTVHGVFQKKLKKPGFLPHLFVVGNIVVKKPGFWWLVGSKETGFFYKNPVSGGWKID